MPFVWIAARFGYDGTGVKIVRTKNDLDVLTDTECIIEELIPFEKIDDFSTNWDFTNFSDF